MIIKFLLILFLFNESEEEVAIENLVGNWERVCLENDALGFQVSHCNFFGDREMYINEWNYIEMTFKNGERKFYDFMYTPFEYLFPCKIGFKLIDP